MAISLYTVSVTSYLQTLDAVSAFLEKGLVHCRDHKIDPNAVVETRLFPNMLPFRFQIRSVVHHSAGAIEGVRNGAFQPPDSQTQEDYAGLQALVTEARDKLRTLTPADVDAYEGKQVVFSIRSHKWVFTAEDFLLSFSLPNFHFHATTTYDILRSIGVPLGKADYMGAMRWKKL